MMLERRCPYGRPRFPLPRHRGHKNLNVKLKVCVMSIFKLRHLDRLAPTFLLFLGMIAAGATAGLGL